MSHRASKSVQRRGQDAVRRIQKTKGRTVTNWVSAPPTPLFRSAPYFARWVAPWTCFLSLSFRTIGQEISDLWGVEVRHFPLTRLIAYTTACCYRTSRDKQKLRCNQNNVTVQERSNNNKLMQSRLNAEQQRLLAHSLNCRCFLEYNHYTLFVLLGHTAHC